MSSPTLIIVDHCGCAGYEPENTIASFQRAIDLGAHCVELDVHVSKDGVPMVIRDAPLLRATSIRGKVSNCLSKTM